MKPHKTHSLVCDCSFLTPPLALHLMWTEAEGGHAACSRPQ